MSAGLVVWLVLLSACVIMLGANAFLDHVDIGLLREDVDKLESVHGRLLNQHEARLDLHSGRCPSLMPTPVSPPKKKARK